MNQQKQLQTFKNLRIIREQVPEHHSISELHGYNRQKQPSIGVLIKRCSEYLQHIYRIRTPSTNRLNRESQNQYCTFYFGVKIFWTILYNYLVAITVDNLQSCF